MTQYGAGATPLRKEDLRLVAGKAAFVDDVHLDGMVHAVFVRSQFAHARILGIDGSKALGAGALAVLTAADLPFLDRKLILRFTHPNIRGGVPTLLASDRVRFVGEAVALVVADNRYLAEDLAELVEVDYDPLPVLSGSADARSPDAVQLHDEWPDNIAAELDHQTGDADAAMASAPHRLKRRFTFARQTGLPLETRGCVADFRTADNRLDIWISTQTHYNVRNNLAEILDIPEYAVRVVASDVGGGFGAKSRPYAEEIVVSHASRLLERPVKWIEDRLESMVATTQSRGTDTELEVGFDETGRVLALAGTLDLDIGAYVFTSGIVTAQVASGQCAGPYKIENIDLKVACVGSNKTPIATYRGAGQPEATFPLETLMDLIADTLGLSPIEVRLRNIVAPADMPYAPHVPYAGPATRFESGDFPEMVRRAADESGFTLSREDIGDREAAAWGLACGIESTGFIGFESAKVRLDPQGNLMVWSGMTSQGQSQATTYAQLAADELGVPFERITVRMGDTADLAFGRGAFASRGAVIGGNAVSGAARRLRDKVLDRAGTLLQCGTEELDIRDGAIVRTNGEETDLSLAKIAGMSLPGGPLFNGDAALEEDYIYDSEGRITFALSVHAAKVAVNRRTGVYRLVDYYVLHDVGRVLHPEVVEGQTIGGVVDGIGCATLSEIKYDDDGQLLTGTLADYLVMTSSDAPRIRIGHMETIPTTNPLGVRGVGEGGIIPVGPAIANAVRRALDVGADRNDTGLCALPLRPDAVLACLDGNEAGVD